jgi:hypothetical protein
MTYHIHACRGRSYVVSPVYLFKRALASGQDVIIEKLSFQAREGLQVPFQLLVILFHIIKLSLLF